MKPVSYFVLNSVSRWHTQGPLDRSDVWMCECRCAVEHQGTSVPLFQIFLFRGPEALLLLGFCCDWPRTLPVGGVAMCDLVLLLSPWLLRLNEHPAVLFCSLLAFNLSGTAKWWYCWAPFLCWWSCASLTSRLGGVTDCLPPSPPCCVVQTTEHCCPWQHIASHLHHLTVSGSHITGKHYMLSLAYLKCFKV